MRIYMQIKGLFKKNIHKNEINNLDSSNINVPDGLYTKCPVCSKIILTEDMYLNNCVCPECGYYRGKLAIEKAVVA